MPRPPVVPIPTDSIAAPTPHVTAVAVTKERTTLDVTPVWFEPIKLPAADKVRLPAHYKKDSPADVRTFECLAMYRSMVQKGQPIDFVSQPFTAAVNNTETVIVVLNELMQELSGRLTFTEKAFQYDDSDYRTACGIGNLGSIHTMINGGENLQTAMFELHLALDYDNVTSSPQTLRDFTVNLINDLSTKLTCKKEFIRVFSVSRASSIYAGVGITTPQIEETRRLADQLRQKLNLLAPTQQGAILQYLINGSYDYKWQAAISYLQLQQSDFDPRFNRDYPQAQEEKRGGRPYYFPQGWYRHALKVEGKYPNDQAWLGMNNSPGEWGVAYHGTAPGAVKNITATGLQHRFFTQDACEPEAKRMMPSIPNVKGLYVATHCERGASIYCRGGFQVEGAPGTRKTYFVVFQCRVQNGKFTEHRGPVNEGLALRVFDEKAIRPYGILLKVT